jgi:hypothetical protein
MLKGPLPGFIGRAVLDSLFARVTLPSQNLQCFMDLNILPSPMVSFLKEQIHLLSSFLLTGVNGVFLESSTLSSDRRGQPKERGKPALERPEGASIHHLRTSKGLKRRDKGVHLIKYARNSIGC